MRTPKQSEERERELQKIVKKGQRAMSLFVDEAGDLNGHTIFGLKSKMKLVEKAPGLEHHLAAFIICKVFNFRLRQQRE